MLAFVIEKVTGKTFAEVVRKFVYEPAGMADAGDIGTVSVVPRLASGYMPDPYSDRGPAVSGPEDTSWKTGGGSGYSMRHGRAVISWNTVRQSARGVRLLCMVTTFVNFEFKS